MIGKWRLLVLKKQKEKQINLLILIKQGSLFLTSRYNIPNSFFRQDGFHLDEWFHKIMLETHEMLFWECLT